MSVPPDKRDRQWHPRPDYPDYRSTRLRAPKKPLVMLPDSLADNSGPVFGHGFVTEVDANLLINHAASGESALGERIEVQGRVIDEKARPVPQALIEIWQANAGGRYRHANDDYLAPLDPNFGGCGRCMTDSEGNYAFHTVKPGPYPWPNGGNDWRPAHIHLSLFGAAFSQRLITQLYFEGDPHIPLCPIVHTIADERAVDQLVARLDMSRTVPMDYRSYRFDIVMRGVDATWFEPTAASAT